MYVTELAESLGMKAQAISNQLQRLLDMGILACKRDGNNKNKCLRRKCPGGAVGDCKSV
jgi:predicted transcriptional regulator